MYSLLHNIRASILDMMRQGLATTMLEPYLRTKEFFCKGQVQKERLPLHHHHPVSTKRRRVNDKVRNKTSRRIEFLI